MHYSYEWLPANREAELHDWDEFVRYNPRGHFCAYSTWLESFTPYGFTYEVLVARGTESGAIAGGIGIIRFGRGPLKLAVATIGPLVAPEHEALGVRLLERLESGARKTHLAFVQVQMPVARDSADDGVLGLLPHAAVNGYGRLRTGQLLNAGLARPFMNVVALHPETVGVGGDEVVLSTFSPSMRRNVRWAQRNVPAAYSAHDAAEVREGYRVIEDNGVAFGYSTRAWGDIGPSLLRQIERGHAEMICTKVEGRVIASAYVIIAGRGMTHLMAGTKRLKPDLHASAHVHWAAMRRAREVGLATYDVTAMSTQGIADFKSGFNPRHVELVSASYIELGRLRTAAFRHAVTLAYRHKGTVGQLLSGLRRLTMRNVSRATVHRGT